MVWMWAPLFVLCYVCVDGTNVDSVLLTCRFLSLLTAGVLCGGLMGGVADVWEWLGPHWHMVVGWRWLLCSPLLALLSLLDSST